jgi:hypothetical protein
LPLLRLVRFRHGLGSIRRISFGRKIISCNLHGLGSIRRISFGRNIPTHFYYSKDYDLKLQKNIRDKHRQKFIISRDWFTFTYQ